MDFLRLSEVVIDPGLYDIELKAKSIAEVVWIGATTIGIGGPRCYVGHILYSLCKCCCLRELDDEEWI